MAEPIDSLSSLRAFVAAAESRSFKTAGQALGLTSSAIGKSIARLEAHLAAPLFHRTTRTISLTEAGSLFLVRARRMLDELRAGEAELAQVTGSPRGRLRISLPLTGDLLTAALATFVARYPQVELDLDFSDRIVDVIDEGFDAVIRTGDTGDSRLLHKTLRRFGWRLVASPDYLADHGLPETPAALVDHVCLRQRFSSGRIAPWPFRSPPDRQPPTSLVASIIDPLLDLAIAGAGIAAFPDFLVDAALADGTLLAVLDDHVEQRGVLTMLWPTSRYHMPKVRAFIDCLSEHLKMQAEPAAGHRG